MKIHLVHAHPEPRSYVVAMKEVLVDEFSVGGHCVTESDLYAMGFDPVISASAFRSRARPGLSRLLARATSCLRSRDPCA